MKNVFKDLYRKVRNLDVVEDLKKEISQIEQDQKDLMGLYIHEVKNPLNQINGFSQLIERSNDSEKIKEFSKYILPPTNKLIKLTDILSLSRVNQKELHSGSRTFNPQDTLKLEKNTNDSYLIKNNINIDSQSPDKLHFNEIIFKFIDSTLTGNALSWTPNNETILKIIENNKNDSTYTIENPVAKEKTSYEHGLKEGLGLSMAKKMIETYGGKMEIYKDIYNIKTKQKTFGVEITIPNKKTIESKL